MSNKSYISMEQHVCIVCGQLFDTGAILLDKRLKDSLENHTTTGNGLCPEHKKLFDEGYVALIEVSNRQKGNTLDMDTANRTGRIMHIRKKAATKILNIPLGSEPLVFVEVGTDTEKGIIDILEGMQHPDDKN